MLYQNGSEVTLSRQATERELKQVVEKHNNHIHNYKDGMKAGKIYQVEQRVKLFLTKGSQKERFAA
jgi:hypothetical protein